MKKSELFHLYAKSNLFTNHYKVLMLLHEKEYTQKELSDELSIAKQNINRIYKDLASMDLVKTGKMVGNNKFLTINTNPTIQMKGQVSILDI